MVRTAFVVLSWALGAHAADFEKMKIRQLKQYISDRGEKCEGCTEKEQFIAKAKAVKHIPLGGAKGAKPKAAAPVDVEEPAAQAEVPDFSKMKIKEIKKFLSDRGVKCKGCTEKAEFIEVAVEHASYPVLGKGGGIPDELKDKAKPSPEEEDPEFDAKLSAEKQQIAMMLQMLEAKGVDLGSIGDKFKAGDLASIDIGELGKLLARQADKTGAKPLINPEEAAEQSRAPDDEF
mmetsp:Transcript_28231/g.67812  ORF Transcript_28231/g.67812 Transcript_28231/m.67812 type:complete len:233 (-) Transcript_28231:99-797(-)